MDAVVVRIPRRGFFPELRGVRLRTVPLVANVYEYLFAVGHAEFHGQRLHLPVKGDGWGIPDRCPAVSAATFFYDLSDVLFQWLSVASGVV